MRKIGFLAERQKERTEVVERLAFTELSQTEASIVCAAYMLVSEGQPVTVNNLMITTKLPFTRIKKILEAKPELISLATPDVVETNSQDEPQEDEPLDNDPQFVSRAHVRTHAPTRPHAPARDFNISNSINSGNPEPVNTNTNLQSGLFETNAQPEKPKRQKKSPNDVPPEFRQRLLAHMETRYGTTKISHSTQNRYINRIFAERCDRDATAADQLCQYFDLLFDAKKHDGSPRFEKVGWETVFSYYPSLVAGRITATPPQQASSKFHTPNGPAAPPKIKTVSDTPEYKALRTEFNTLFDRWRAGERGIKSSPDLTLLLKEIGKRFVPKGGNGADWLLAQGPNAFQYFQGAFDNFLRQRLETQYGLQPHREQSNA